MIGKSGVDWNGNGKTDAFDHYMNTKAVSDVSSRNNDHSRLDDTQKASGIVMNGKVIYDASKDSDGVVILKSLLVVTLCIGGIVFPAIAGLEGLIVALFPLGAVGLSMLILNNT